ncbi:MAG: DUF393 domain-containing protein [Bryobacterales bacterium]|nr:DUF393 domain-containing protein [Bryobacterales bacterium]
MYLANAQQKTTVCRHLLLYDGSCGLCDGLAMYVMKFDRRATFCFASLQSDFAARLMPEDGRSRHQAETLVVFADFQQRSRVRYTKAQAALFVLGALGWPWKLAVVLHLIPSGLLDSLYDFIARNRFRIRRVRPSCRPHGPEYNDRLLDARDDLTFGKEARP